MFDIIRYTPDRADEWNRFVAASKNGTFLFDRGYMDYHSDRFKDYSLMFYDKGELYALLPANQVGDRLFTHQGLTYGGLIMSQRATTAKVCELFSDQNEVLRLNDFRTVEYKPVPWIYHLLPSEEPLYALTKVCKAKVVSRDVASVVVLDHRIPFTKLRRRGANKAARCGIRVEETDDFAPFWTVLEDNLMTRYHTQPVHTLKEIELLKSRFPQNIRLFVATNGGEVVGGTVLYISGSVVKTQYISSSEQGRQMGVLDRLFSELLDSFALEGYRYFDFGTSNFKTSDDLHQSLIFQKEGFGGRAICYDTYEWEL